MDHVQVLKKDIPGRGDRKSKKPEADAWQSCLTSQGARLLGH